MTDALASLLHDTHERSIPIAAIVELTRRCNLACVHCYAEPEKGRLELNRDQLCGVIDELRDLGTLFLTLLGGEPTLHRDFLAIARHASDRKMCVQFFTNGLRLDAPMADALAALSVFHVGVSLYGATAPTHDRITRARGSWERTLAAARLLRDRGIYVCFKFTAMNLNIHEVDAAAALAAEMGIPIRFSPNLQPRDNLDRAPLDLWVSKEQHKKLLKDYFQNEIRRKNVDPGGLDLGCGMGRALVSINAYGDVFPCTSLPIPAGNVRHCSLKEIWHGSPLLREVRRFPRMDKMHGCPECALRAWCCRCPGNAFTETGDLYGPQPTACREAVVMKEIDEERRGAPSETPLPPGLSEAHLPGWTANEIAELSGAGSAACASHAFRRDAADFTP